MFARVVTALCHGAFFGIGSVVAASLVPANRRASAVALMFTGLTLANVLGVPLGTALGQAAGWRSTFWAVTAIGVIALIGLVRYLPLQRRKRKSTCAPNWAPSRGRHLAVAKHDRAVLGLDVRPVHLRRPLLGDVTGVSPRGVTGPCC